MLVLTFFGDRDCPTDRWRGLIDEYSGLDDLSSLPFEFWVRRAVEDVYLDFSPGSADSGPDCG